MSQTDPKPQQSHPSPSAGKPSDPKSPKTAGAKTPRAKGGSQAFVYVGVVLLVVVAIFAVNFLRKGGDERRPVVSAAEEEEIAMESETETETETESVATVAALVITSDVRGADVYLNGNRVGKTPHKATPLTPGDYDVKVVHEGYQTFESQVHVETPDDSIHADLPPMKGGTNTREASNETVEEREPAAAPANIRRLAETVPVKHNHRIGSCAGILHAGDDGLRYETDHKDAFFAAYSDLEEFHVDGNELTLKVRDGRKYDFQEQNDDAELLAAFHAGVEALRH